MNFFKAGRLLLTVILRPCYSEKFVYEDVYQDDDYYRSFKEEDIEDIEHFIHM